MTGTMRYPGVSAADVQIWEAEGLTIPRHFLRLFGAKAADTREKSSTEGFRRVWCPRSKIPRRWRTSGNVWIKTLQFLSKLLSMIYSGCDRSEVEIDPSPIIATLPYFEGHVVAVKCNDCHICQEPYGGLRDRGFDFVTIEEEMSSVTIDKLIQFGGDRKSCSGGDVLDMNPPLDGDLSGQTSPPVNSTWDFEDRFREERARLRKLRFDISPRKVACSRSSESPPPSDLAPSHYLLT